ncbi:MAG: endolytic transglycosylase MltG [Rhodospirillaceae bacterium]|nr:endolytic transglycosylase MltG [Rhodospirillaceae bacterium]MBT5778679.1 endolytic transglycosylase MltG [Rhodospirillaceae bacterium]
MALAAPYRRALIWILVPVVIIAAACVGGWVYFVQDFDSPGAQSEPVTLIVLPGSSAWEIAEALYAAGVIADPNVFAVGVWRSGAGSALKAGEFQFPPHVTPRQAMNIVRAGKALQYRLTIPEGLTSAEIVRLLESAEALDGVVAEIPPEGALLPETYQYRRGDSRTDMIDRMLAGMHSLIAELWPNRAENLPFETPEQALVLASIVEKETALAAERRQVAGVFVNRLRKGMHLQSDPTVIFAVTGGTAPLERPLSKADLALDSPFNTYRHKGLPPRPIAHPGRDSLAAVLNPEPTDALFFVADGSGGHVFADTLAAHNKNVARWRKLQKERAK